MPRAFDTRSPVALHDPTRTDLNFSIGANWDLAQLMLDGLENFFKLIKDELLGWLTDLTGVDFKALADEWTAMCQQFLTNDLLQGFIGLGSGDTVVAQFISGIQSIFGGLLDNIINNDLVDALITPLLDFAQWVWSLFTDAAPGDLIDTILKPVMEFGKWLGDSFSGGLLDTILKPVLEFFSWVWSLFGAVGNPGSLVETILKPVMEFAKWLGDTFTHLVPGDLLDSILKPVLEFFSWVWSLFGAAGDPGSLVETILKPVMEFAKWLGDTFTHLVPGDLLDSVLKPFLEFAQWLWSTFTDVLHGDLIDSVLKPFLEFGQWLWSTFTDVLPGDLIDTVLKPVFEFFGNITNTFGTVQDWVSSLGLGNILSVIGTITGNFSLETLGEGLVAIVGWAQKVPTIDAIIHAITGIPGTIGDLVSWALKLLNLDSIIPSINLLGSIPQELVSLIPAAHIGAAQPNLVTDQAFSSAAAVEAGNGWSWDGTTNAAGSDGGSAKVVGDGGVKYLFSNTIDVAPNQSLSLTAKFKWTKQLGAQPTILVGVRAYYKPPRGNITPTVVGTYTAASIVAYTGTTTTAGTFYLGSGSSATLSGGWVNVVGSYTVPSNVNQLRLVLGTTSATSGTTVWFDDATITKTQLISQSLVKSLTTDLQSLLPIGDWQNLLNTVAKTTGASLSDVQNMLNSFLNGGSTLNGSMIGVGNISAAFVKELVDTWNSTYLSITGQAASSGALTNLSSALSNFAASVAQNGSKLVTVQAATNTLTSQHASASSQISILQTQVADLQTKLNTTVVTPPPAPVIVTAFDDFERTSTATIGSNWNFTYRTNDGSTLATPDGHNAVLQLPLGSISGNACSAIYSGTPGKLSSTRYQWISATLGSGGGIPLIGTRGFCELIGLAASPTTCVLVRFYADGVIEFRYRLNGWTDYVIGTFNAGSNPTTGTTIEFFAGSKTASDQTRLSAKFGTSVIGPSYISAATLASMGQGWGFGMGSGLSGLAPQAAPIFNYWTAQDQ